jgi:3-methylcrotonyl-CoA carboxylase alpha subunit
VHSASRAEAVALLQRALAEVRIAGVGNNIAFLRRLAASAEFARGEVDIGFIERTPVIVHGAQHTAEPRALAAAALWVLAHEHRTLPQEADGGWGSNDGWRLNAHLTRRLQFETGGAEPAEESVVIDYAPGGLRIALSEDGASVPASLHRESEGVFHLQFGAEGARLGIEPDGEHLRISLGSADYRVRWRNPRQPVVEGYLADSSLAAPMPGRIIAQVAVAGSAVKKGAPLLIMEAMKMEHTICAPANGVVRTYLAAVGQQVTEGTELIDFETQ